MLRIFLGIVVSIVILCVVIHCSSDESGGGEGLHKTSPDGKWLAEGVNFSIKRGEKYYYYVEIKVYGPQPDIDTRARNKPSYWSFKYDTDSLSFFEDDAIKWNSDSSGFVVTYKDKIGGVEGNYKLTFNIADKHFLLEGPIKTNPVDKPSDATPTPVK